MLANLLLFAQQDMPDFSAEMPEAAVGALFAGILVGMLVGILIGVAIAAVVAYLLYSCFQRIPAQHRQMEPWQAWLLLIPIFNVVWMFFVFPKLTKSYQGYFGEQGRTDVGDCGEKIGFACAVCYAVSLVGGFVPCLGMIVGPIAALAGLILLIVFLVKALTLKGQIPEGAA
ncbi:MAG TPA: hypothetical protein VMY37_19380 [Thermoguttaceae bacterium]|nr:hypothetical protein [Thermoguttaceae bacterium]